MRITPIIVLFNNNCVNYSQEWELNARTKHMDILIIAKYEKR